MITEDQVFADHLAAREAVPTARSLSVELCAEVAVAYDSERYDNATAAVLADDLAVVVVSECAFGEPWRWGDWVWFNGKKTARPAQ